MLSLRNVSHGFQDGSNFRWLFENLSFEFQSGESVNLWGPSGSGKTTLLNILAGLQRPAEGTVICEAESSLDLAAASEQDLLRYRRHKIGFIYQFFNLIPTLTVLENVELPLELTAQNELKSEARRMLEDFNLGGRLDAFPETLSGGEQQRVAVVRALVHRPAVVLADEPTGNLDHENAQIVVDRLFTLSKHIGSTLVLASHDLKIREQADHVLTLDA